MKSATDSPCRFSALKARIFGCSKNKALWGVIAVVVTCLGMALFAPMAEKAWAEGETTCFVVKYKQEGTDDVKGVATCGKVSGGKITEQFVAGKTELPAELLEFSTSAQNNSNTTGSADFSYKLAPTYATTSNNIINGSATTHHCLGEDKTFQVGCSVQAEYKQGDDVTVIQSMINAIGAARKTATITVDGEEQKWEYQEISTLTGSEAESWSTTGSSDDACRSATGLAWLVCPAIEMLESATTSIYENVVQQFLQIDSGAFSGTNSEVYKAWQIFQNFANIALVFIILFIVFSQLTGVGIDNYGIKKSLPKLIVAIILINLSYFIAQLCVDLANILGYSLKLLFDGLAEQVELAGGGLGVGAAAVTEVGATAAVVTGTVAVLVSSGGWAAVGLAFLSAIPVILGGLLSALIAIAFLFILLAARQAGVILFVIISPLAIVCYILPNTQGVFKKWLKIFETLLLVYPICGLLMGAGGFASVILLAVMGSGAWASLVALLTSVVPFFFIPSILKSSMAGLGNLGAKISGVGRNLGGKTSNLASRGLRNSSLYKNAQQSLMRGQVRNKAGLDKNGKPKELNAFQRMLRGNDKGIAMHRAQYVKDLKEQMMASYLLDDDGFANKMDDLQVVADEAEVSKWQNALGYGRVDDGSGGKVNTSDAKSLGGYHLNRLKAYQNATTDGERKVIMSQIKAAQNILSKTDGGRTKVGDNLMQMVRIGRSDKDVEGVKNAAQHLAGNFGDIYKTKNRGTNELIQDLARNETLNAMHGKMFTTIKDSRGMAVQDANGPVIYNAYDAAGIDKYDANGLAGADTAALNKLNGYVNTMLRAQNVAKANGVSLQQQDIDKTNKIIATSHQAVTMNDDSKNNFTLKPEVRGILDRTRNGQP